MSTPTTDLFAAPTPFAAAEDDGVKRDRFGRYLLPDPKSGRELPWTRATTFAKSIADTFTLSQWSQRMAIKGVTMRPDLYAAVAATSLDNRKELNRLAESAKEVAGAKTAAGLGTALHSFTEQHDRGEPSTVPPPWYPHLAAYAATLEEHGITVLPRMIERIVVCQRYSIAGTFDRLFAVKTPCPACGKSIKVGDLKTGRTLEYGWNEIAIQLAVYGNAELIWDREADRYEPMPDVCLCSAIVVHLPALAPEDGATCTLYEVDIAAGWEAAELCVLVRQWRKAKGLATPLTVVQANREALSLAHAGYAERLRAASTVADLSAVFFEAQTRGEWTPELQSIGLARRAAIIADIAGG